MDNSNIEEKEIQKETEKYCIQCQHYKGFRWESALDDDTGACAFRTLRSNRKDSQCMKDIEHIERCPVTGTLRYFFKHRDALAVRNDESACGLEGKWYEEWKEEKEIRKRVEGYRKEEKKKKGTISVDDLI